MPPVAPARATTDSELDLYFAQAFPDTDQNWLN